MLTVPSGTITLVADPTNEVGEVWSQANDAVRMLALFFVLTVLLIYWAVGRALAPLERLAGAFGRIGAGDYAARVDAVGPPELVRLASGFNGMAEQLGEVEAQNRQLQEQLLSLQEEERADLARDLHDEIGPFLFAAASMPPGFPRCWRPAGLARRSSGPRPFGSRSRICRRRSARSWGGCGH